MNRIAHIISAVLNPLVVIIVMSFILAYEDTRDIVVSLRWGLILLAFVLAVSFLIWILVKRKIFSNFDVSLQHQRPRLYLLELTAALIYLITIYFLHSPVMLWVQTISIILTLIALLFVNKFIKASGHIAVLTGAVTLLAFINGWLFLFGLVPVGVLAWSRLELERHSLKEVLTGGLIGVLASTALAVI